jgi:hypothetical protein
VIGTPTTGAVGADTTDIELGTGHSKQRYTPLDEVPAHSMHSTDTP